MNFLPSKHTIFANVTRVLTIRSYNLLLKYIRSYWVVMGIKKSQGLYSLHFMYHQWSLFSWQQCPPLSQLKGQGACGIGRDECYFGFSLRCRQYCIGRKLRHFGKLAIMHIIIQVSSIFEVGAKPGLKGLF